MFFTALGALVTIACVVAEEKVNRLLPYHRAIKWPELAILSLPLFGAAYVVRRRLRDGKRWRWLSFLIGGIAGLFALWGIATWGWRIWDGRLMELVFR